MGARTLIQWAGMVALLGGILAVILTPPLAISYEYAYGSRSQIPPWLHVFEPLLGRLLTFGSAPAVYATYGKIFALVYLLILPGLVALHALQSPRGGRMEAAMFLVLVGGLVLSFVGVTGDYWRDGATWELSLVGLLILLIGTSGYGIITVRVHLVPWWSAWLLLLAGPGGIAVTLFLVRHIPSGPTLLFGLAWIVLGVVLLVRQ